MSKSLIKTILVELLLLFELFLMEMLLMEMLLMEVLLIELLPLQLLVGLSSQWALYSCATNLRSRFLVQTFFLLLAAAKAWKLRTLIGNAGFVGCTLVISPAASLEV